MSHDLKQQCNFIIKIHIYIIIILQNYHTHRTTCANSNIYTSKAKPDELLNHLIYYNEYGT